MSKAATKRPLQAFRVEHDEPVARAVVETQSRELALDPTRPLVMRWMLRGNHEYEEAKDLYAPFDRLVEPDDASRDALARLARAALDAGLGTWIIVNNKAEGSSPLSVERLAARIAG